LILSIGKLDSQLQNLQKERDQLRNELALLKSQADTGAKTEKTLETALVVLQQDMAQWKVHRDRAIARLQDIKEGSVEVEFTVNCF
jgi:chromosome segregation ATPase